jgi:hypothetical protein
VQTSYLLVTLSLLAYHFRFALLIFSSALGVSADFVGLLLRPYSIFWTTFTCAFSRVFKLCILCNRYHADIEEGGNGLATALRRCLSCLYISSSTRSPHHSGPPSGPAPREPSHVQWETNSPLRITGDGAHHAVACAGNSRHKTEKGKERLTGTGISK